MEQFDEALKNMAKQEECIVPEGFDGRLQEALAALPPRAKKRRGLGLMKSAAIAAAACVLLAGTALAASPGLREMLGTALGGFAPYAQEQEDKAYVIDGIEFKVGSVLADDFTIRAYVEARDLEGGRLSKLELNTFGSAFGLVDLPRKDTGPGVSGFVSSGVCLDYDEESKTALLAVTSWGQVPSDDLSGAAVKLFNLVGDVSGAHQDLWENSDGVAFPVEVKLMPSLTASAELASAFQAEEVRMSSLSLSMIFKGDGAWSRFAGTNVSAKMADGTLVEAPWEGGQGNFGAYGTDSARKVLVWNFREPVEPEQIEGVYVGEDYFPIK